MKPIILHFRFIHLVLFTFLLFVVSCTTTPAVKVELPPQHQALLAELRAGKLTILLRHALTDWQQKDLDDSNLQDCSKQRNLSRHGRGQAATIGESFSALGIPVGHVYSSPYCRSIDTGKIAFGKYQIDEHLLALKTAPAAVVAKSVSWTKDQLASKPSAKGNNIFITHSYNIKAVSNQYTNEGDAVILRPLGDQGFEYISTVAPEQWREMALLEE